MEGIDRNKRIHVEGESDCRSWNEMIPDALGLIFKDLPLHGLLQVIPLVCKSWGKVVEGPYCWQKIDIEKWSQIYKYMPEKLDRMLRMLITRSSGSLLELRASYVNDDMMSFIAEHAGSLQTLILKRSVMSDSVVEKVATKLSSVTTLDLSYGCLSTQALEAIGRSCKMLVSLNWNITHRSRSMDILTNEARVIARTMPKLKRLDIANLNINTPVVLEILSGCPELETLYILGCKSVESKLVEEKYPKLNVRGPYDPFGYFDGDKSEYSEDGQSDACNCGSSGTESSWEDRAPQFDPYDIDAYNDYYCGY